MEIYILFFLFFSSFHPFSSSPVTKKQLDAYNDPVAKLESSIKAITPEADNYISKVHHQSETSDKKSAATATSAKNNERIANTHTTSNSKNNVKHLGNATENQHEDCVKKAMTGEKSTDAYNGAIQNMESSMYDYFSMMLYVLNKLEEKKNEKSAFTSTSNENKGHTADAHLSSNVKNNKHMNNTTNVRRQDDLSKVEISRGSSLDAYNNAIQEIESFKNEIMPQIDDYFSNMHIILNIQPEKRAEKSVATSKSIENRERIEEVTTSPNVLNDKTTLNNALHNQHDIGLSEIKANENSFGDYNNTIVKRSESIKPRMPQKDVYFLKKHHILKRHVGKEEKSVATSKSTEKKTHILKNKQLHEISNEVDYQLTQANRSVLSNLSTGSISQNKSSSMSDNSRFHFLQNQHPEKLETKKSGTSKKSLKTTRIITDGNVATTSMNSKAELTYPKESSHMKNKIYISTEGIFNNYQNNIVRKTDSTTLTSLIVDENEINVMRSTTSDAGNHMIKQKNSDGETSSLTSDIWHTQKYEESSTKEPGETPTKQHMTKNKIMDHSTSTNKLDIYDEKSLKADKKQAKKKNDSTNIFSS